MQVCVLALWMCAWYHEIMYFISDSVAGEDIERYERVWDARGADRPMQDRDRSYHFP